MADTIKINQSERMVLEVLAEEWSSDSNCFYFRGIQKRLETSPNFGKDPSTLMFIADIRRACRSLARKGLAQYVRGLFDEDGQVAGAGYCATEKGAAMISPCDVCGELAVYDYIDKQDGPQPETEEIHRIRECEAHYKKSPKLFPKLPL